MIKKWLDIRLSIFSSALSKYEVFGDTNITRLLTMYTSFILLCFNCWYHPTACLEGGSSGKSVTRFWYIRLSLVSEYRILLEGTCQRPLLQPIAVECGSTGTHGIGFGTYDRMINES